MSEEEINYRRRALLAATATVGGVGVAVSALPFISSLNPAGASPNNAPPVEVDISALAPGQMQTVKWQGKPVWILHRTHEMIDSLAGHESSLIDPDSTEKQQPQNCSNFHRSIRPEIFVAVGLCTHYGCTPHARFEKGSVASDWPGGFLCGCHASGFDLAGRVFKNKLAKMNLEIPPHAYLGNTRLRIGEAEKIV